MQSKMGDIYQAEIRKRLGLAKSQVERIIFTVESGSDWKDIHEQTDKAIFQLRKATKLLAQYHMEVCIIGKHRETNIPIAHEDINEIMKTYRYLN